MKAGIDDKGVNIIFREECGLPTGGSIFMFSRQACSDISPDRIVLSYRTKETYYGCKL